MNKEQQAVKEFAEELKFEMPINQRVCCREYDIGYNDGYSEALYRMVGIIDAKLKELEV